MTETVFFDTNVLVYAHDPRDARKRDIALALIGRYFETRTGIISTQVLQELFVSLTGRTARLPVPVVTALVADYALFPLVNVRAPQILTAIDLHARHKISFWDGLIVAAAKSAGVSTLFTEDLTDGRTYDGVLVRNPFRGERN